MSALKETRAQFERANLHPDDIDGRPELGFKALCTVCPQTLTVRPRADYPHIEIECPTGCEFSRIADELHFRIEATPGLNGSEPRERSSWEPIDLEPILSGDFEQEQPEILARQDGHALLYSGRLHAVFGEPESGKGWFSLAACKATIAARQRVLYIDYEDNEFNIAGRLHNLGVPDDAILEFFNYVRPQEPVSDDVLAGHLAREPALAVIDGVTEALAIEGLDMASNQDIAVWIARLARPLARAGAAVALLDHVVKERTAAKGRYAIGAQHKLAAVDVAYRLDVVHPFGRGRKGLVKVFVTKDRAGAVREHAVGDDRIADMQLVSGDGGGVTVTLEAPEGSGSGKLRPTVLMERVSDALIAEPGLTTREIRELKGANDWLDEARRVLLLEGFVRSEPDGKATRHYSVRPFKEGADVIALAAQMEAAA